MDRSGTFLNNRGDVIYANARYRESTAGPNEDLSAVYDPETNAWTYTGRWEN